MQALLKPTVVTPLIYASKEGPAISATSKEGSAISAVSDEDIISEVSEQYVISGLSILDNMSLRRSNISQKPYAKGAAVKYSTQKKYFNLSSIFYIFKISALTTLHV